MKLSPQSVAPYKRAFVSLVRSLLLPNPVQDARRDPRSLSLAFALLFGSGALLVLLTLLLPHSPGRNPASLIAVAAAAAGVAGAMVVFGNRCPMWLFRALPLEGAILVSIVIYSGGETAVGAYAMFYSWVILAAFYFFPGWWGLINLASVGVQYALVTHALGTENAELMWVMLMGTLVVGALFLSLLQDHSDRATGEREKLLVQVERLASTDPLTSLPNRRAWEARLGEELRRAGQRGTPLAVVILDIDGLKAINDLGGHHAGDRAIRRATAGWRSALREADFIARLGGDEFGALLQDCPEEVALTVLERMREATPSVAWSAGIAVWDGDEHAGALLRRADSLLYEAKRSGRNRALPGETAFA